MLDFIIQINIIKKKSIKELIMTQFLGYIYMSHISYEFQLIISIHIKSIDDLF